MCQHPAQFDHMNSLNKPVERIFTLSLNSTLSQSHSNKSNVKGWTSNVLWYKNLNCESPLIFLKKFPICTFITRSQKPPTIYFCGNISIGLNIPKLFLFCSPSHLTLSFHLFFSLKKRRAK